MIIVIQREVSDDRKTFGKLFIDGQYFCETLEDVVRPVKIHGETAIPAGVYPVTLEKSPRFGPNTISVHKVENFKHIRVHGGNHENNTEGCPLVGMERTATGIRNCKPALDELKHEIGAALQAGEQVWLEIRDA
jgi:hypothetical protein